MCKLFHLHCYRNKGYGITDSVLDPSRSADWPSLHSLQALESDYVSARLHLWIDLIFGYRQQGSPAVEALNTFHPYFYTDKHDRATMKDPVVKSTILGYINNFGQMPKQVRQLSSLKKIRISSIPLIFLFVLNTECNFKALFTAIYTRGASILYFWPILKSP